MQATLAARTACTDLDDVFLDRLRSLVARQRAALTPAERTTLSIATFSIFLDCLDRGLHAEAHALLDELHGVEEQPGGSPLRCRGGAGSATAIGRHARASAVCASGARVSQPQ